jgi:Family of unknown function (DUF5701)
VALRYTKTCPQPNPSGGAGVPPALPSLPALAEQAERLIELGAHQIGGLSAARLREEAGRAPADRGLLVMHPGRASASRLASLIEHGGKRGFVVADMPDADDFAPIGPVRLPVGPVYVTVDLDRGDHLANWSPDEALPAIIAAGRTPLTLGEGIHWLLQQPEVLERNRCFMTIGSRLHRTSGPPDRRAPALWISNGTGRDGRENRNAPKVGWCWAGNRHTWLGFASAASRMSTARPCAPARSGVRGGGTPSIT